MDKLQLHDAVVFDTNPVLFTNGPLLRKFNRMIQDAHDNLPEGTPPMPRDSFRKWVLVLAGHCNPVVIEKDGQLYTIFEPKSIAIESLSNQEFREVFAKVHNVLMKYFYYDHKFNDLYL